MRSLKLRISNSNKWSCFDKHIAVDTRIVIKHCVDGKETVEHNTTITLYFTVDRELKNRQETFENEQCTFFRM